MGLKRADYTNPAKPPAGKRAVDYPAANVSSLVVFESLPISAEFYKPIPYGTPHESYATTGLILVKQRQVKAENNQVWVTRVYASRNINEDWFDYTLRYAGDVVANPIFIRTYRKLRNEYQPIAKGSPFTGVYRMIVTAVGANYTAAPTVVFTGANTTPAAAKAIMSPPDTNRKMTLIGLELTDEGLGYTAAPAISFTGGGGTGAAATAYIQPAAAILVKEEVVELDNEAPDMASLFVKVTRVYETLPGPLLHWEEYEDEKAGGQRNRGSVHRTSQSVYRAGTEVPAFTRPSAGLARKVWFEPRGESAIVLTKFQEDWTEILITDKAWTEEFFGGILEIDETRDTPGAQTPTPDFLVTETDTRTVSPAEQVLTTKTRTGGDWQEVIEEKMIDEGLFTGVRIEIRKQYVRTVTTNPHPNPFAYDPPTFTEFQPHDFLRKLQLTSKILSYPGTPLVYYDNEEIHIPPKLTNTDFDWAIEAQEGGASHVSLDDTVAQSTASGMTEIMPITKILADNGFRGAALARITKSFFLMTTEGVGPGSGIIPVPQPIIPSNGVAILCGRRVQGDSVLGNVNHSLEMSGRIIREIREFGPFLTAGVNVDEAHAVSATAPGFYDNSASATAGPKPGDFSAVLITSSPDATIKITAPASTPTSLVSGTWYVWRVRVTQGPLGLFVIEVIEIKAP